MKKSTKENLSFWMGFCGGLAGLIVFGYTVKDKWWDSRPRLQAFNPIAFSGTDPQWNDKRCLFVLLRIANFSDCPAFLYLETLKVSVKYQGKYYDTMVTQFDPNDNIDTGMSPAHVKLAGLKHVKFFSPYQSSLVDKDSPLTGYICISLINNENEQVLLNPEGYIVKVRDCHLNEYEMTIDLQQQAKFYQPQYEIINPKGSAP